MPDSLQRLDIKIHIAGKDSLSGKDLHFTMQRVEGGSFMMGATLDQTDTDTYTDKPAHLVFLSPYYIATTEVTVQLWRAVMPDKEIIIPKGYPTVPVSYVSWFECQEFVRRLDSITEMPFRLPTEAEWEYAARGGNRSKAFRFAGGNEPDSVGWTYSCSGDWKHPVARKQPNELGLYDMTGNVSEWCQDRYGAYQLSTPPDPCGADTGSYRIVRGGSYDDCAANSHLSVRRWFLPETATEYIGLRVAMTLPNDPVLSARMSAAAADANGFSLTRSVRIKGKKLKFIYVPAEQPYYISEEIECPLWRKMMQSNPPGKNKRVALGMSTSDRTRFAEYCSRAAKEALLVASAEQIVLAEQQGLIEPFQPDVRHKRRNNSTRAIQRRRKNVDRFSPWTELVGVRLPKPDDPVLLQYKKADDESRPLRLVIYLR